jgi:hypothetical protein
MSNIRKKVFTKFIFCLALPLPLLLLFQSCGKGFQAASIYSSSHLYKSGIEACDNQIKEDFSDSLYLFANTYSCQECHNNNDNSPRSFADSDITVALDQFSNMGGIKTLNRVALSDHQTGYTGEFLRGDLNLAKNMWDEAIVNFDRCTKTLGNKEKQSITSQKRTSLFEKNGDVVQLGKEEILLWQLDESNFSPHLPGVIFKITVSVEKNVHNNLEYHIKNPTLISGSNSLSLENVDILINNKKQGKTTYTFSKQNLGANSRLTLSTTRSIFQKSKNLQLNSSDKFSIHFHSITLSD